MADMETTSKEAKTEFAFRHRYETLRSLLYRNGTALQLMSDLEADLNHLEYSNPALWRPVQRLLDESLLMAQELNLLTGDKYRLLYDLVTKLRGQIRQVFATQSEGENRNIALRLDSEDCFECADCRRQSGRIGRPASPFSRPDP